jgi:hypothetical protein
MLAHALTTAASVLVASGMLFQLVTSARLGARCARARFPLVWRSVRPDRAPTTRKVRNVTRHPPRDYRTALRAAAGATTRRPPQRGPASSL